MTWGFSTGVVNGHAHITGDLITDLFSASTRGAVKRRNWLLEGLYDFVAYVGFASYLRLFNTHAVFDIPDCGACLAL